MASALAPGVLGDRAGRRVLVASFLGFVLAAVWWRSISWPDAWRAVGSATALASCLGIVLFFRTWPMGHTLSALGMNMATVLRAIARVA